MGSSGQQPVTQQTTQTKDPWSYSQPGLIQAMDTARGLASSDVGYKPFTGNTTAPWLNAYSQPAASTIQSLATSEPLGSTNLQGARDYLGGLVSNEGLSDPLSSMASNLATNANPYLQGAIDQQMNKVNTTMAGAGRYGSGQHAAGIAAAIAPTLAADFMQRQGMAADIYGQGLQRAGQAAQLIPSLDQARFANAGNLMALGDQQRAYDQALLDQQLKLWNAQEARQWEQQARLMAISGQAGALGGSQITSSPGATQPSSTQRMLGGALAGAGLGSAIFPGIGTGIGALGGGLLGLM